MSLKVDWKEFKDENDLPLNVPLILKLEQIELPVITKLILKDDYVCTYDLEYILNIHTNKITHWSTLEEIKQEEQKELVTYNFTLGESELSDLQEFLVMVSDYIGEHDLKDWQEKEKKLEKFIDLFEKVRF